jgi:hypothetical protein
MGRYLRWSIIAANEDQHLAGRRHARGSLVNNSSRKSQRRKQDASAGGCGQHAEEPRLAVATADGRSRSKRSCGSPTPVHQCVAKIAASRKLTSSPAKAVKELLNN